MKKLFALTMAGICAIAFAAATDAATTLRMKAPTVKTATRTASNIVQSGSVEVQYVYSDWSNASTAVELRAAEGGKYDVTTLYLGNLLTSQQVYDDLREKFLTTEFDYTRIANNGTADTTKTKQQIGLLSTLVPSVADETILTAVISVGKAYNDQKAGNNYYDFQSTTDKDGKYVYSDFSEIGDKYSGILSESGKVIPGRVASHTAINAEAADLLAAIANNNGKTFTKEEAAQKSAELENLFYVSEKTAWDNQQEANKISVKNLVSQLQSKYDSFTNAQADEMSKTQDALNAIVAGLNNGSMTYEEALAKLQDIINGISNFDKSGYNNLLNNYASQLASLKASFESEFAALQNANASSYANASAKAESDKAALQATRDNAINAAEQEKNNTIAAAQAAVDKYNAANDKYSTLLENYSDEKDVIKDNYQTSIDQLESERDDRLANLEEARQGLNGSTNTSGDNDLQALASISAYIDSIKADYDSQISAVESARDAELAAVHEKYEGTNGLLTQAQAAIDSAKSACNGNPSTYVANRTSAANATYNTAVANANNAYQAGVNKIDTELANLKASNDAALKAVEDKYAANKLALEKKAESALASFVLDQFVAMQNAENAKMLAELKAELTSFINGLTDSKGNAYSTANISNYDSLQFNEVSYNSIAYNKNYSAADYAAEKAKGTFDVDISEEVEVNVNDNEFLSALSVSSKSQVTMVDGVLQEVTTNTESLYKTTIYIEAERKYISPIVLDIKGDGVLQASDGHHLPGHSTVRENNIITDFYGDGFEIAMEWVGPQDGLLVAPKADGSVDISCLFGVAGGYESGYEKLSLYDKNGDNKVSGEELNGLSVWQDANSNGIADEGEVKTVQELGITSLGITNSLDFTSTFERNGQSYKMWDWWPNAVELIKVAAK